jgi:peroxiredoxin
MTGVPGKPLPENWDAIPGARGCTPQACNFRDHNQEFVELETEVIGLSTQTTEYQREMADRLQLPFEVLSDAAFQFCGAMRLPTFVVDGTRLLKRLTIVVRGRARRARHLSSVSVQRKRRSGIAMAQGKSGQELMSRCAMFKNAFRS